MEKPLLQIRNLSVQYNTRQGIVDAVNNVSFDIQHGEILGLVGESGCGKSTMGKAIMRLIQAPGKITGGELWLDGVDLMTLPENEMRNIRGKRLGMIFQDPMTSLNPVQRIIEHLIETIQTHEPQVTKQAATQRSEALVDRLGVRKERIQDYPHQLSGGMRQRVMIALALALKADLVIADEATTSLDVIVEAQFLDLLRELRDEFDLTILLITHNIGVVAEAANRVAVMYAGKLVELGNVYDVFANPLHPYANGLLNAVPNIRLEEDKLYKMGGSPPNLAAPPPGCRFHPRCPEVMDICSKVVPELKQQDSKRWVACWLNNDRHAHPKESVN